MIDTQDITGIVLAGGSAIDESLLTGEPQEDDGEEIFSAASGLGGITA